MAWTTRLLVVANRTADSDELSGELHRRAAGGAALTVMLVVPAPLGHEVEVGEHLDRVLESMRADGIEAEGVVGDSDPVNATLDVWDPRRFDEILVCTLPPGESTWLHVDLPHRLRRLTDATVTHIVARVRLPVAAGAPAAKRERPPWFERLFPLSAPRAR